MYTPNLLQVRQEPSVKKILYWCRSCNIPLIGRTCGCGEKGEPVELLQPYDIRPALKADHDLIRSLLFERFGDIPVPKILLFNKAGGYDRNDLVLANGGRFGWLSFDPCTRKYTFMPAPEAVGSLLPFAEKGVIDLTGTGATAASSGRNRRIGGKKIPVSSGELDGPVIIRYGDRYGTGVLCDGQVKVKELIRISSSKYPDPDWGEVVRRNYGQLKELERNAVREIKFYLRQYPCANVSFSGGKDSTAVYALARKAGVEDAYFVDTTLEFPETYTFVRSSNVRILPPGGDFWAAVEKAGPPGKDNRWCCKMLKLFPVRKFLEEIGPCLTIQGNRWYESNIRAGLEALNQNPANPNQTNLSPIRSWRAFEVFLYLMWRNIPYNPLYDMGFERIGCWLCPAMLESEYELMRETHPEQTSRWDAFLDRWGEKSELSYEYLRCGFWRWREHPPKVQELAREHQISLLRQKS